MARTDIHRPSAIVPADYDYVGIEHMKIQDFGHCGIVLSERERIRRHMECTGGTYSAHAHGGNCHICGAHAVYTVLFHHKPSNVYVRTGMDCADKLDWDSGAGEAFRAAVQDVMARKAGKAKAAAILEKAGLSAAYTIYCGDQRADAGREESIIVDIVGKLVQYGSISDAQTNFLRKLVDAVSRRDEIAEQRRIENEAAAPFPVSETRIPIKGKVLSIRLPHPQYGGSTKMLVQHADGWKAWGSLPSSIAPAVGDIVEFHAAIKASDKDPKFGFFSRPTKAQVVAS